ncbi:MAG: YitT family protein [Spirochaetia bacterium]|nr:YitT family protein [Spirochaetia bacterium]MCF7941767.1 YitT family protein [Spirochaetia bacterium]
MKHEMIYRKIEEYLLITIGSAVTALALVLFLTPAKIAAGGVSGLAIILYHWYGWDPGLVIFILSIPIFVLGVKVFGGRFGLKSLYGTFALSLSVTLFGILLGYDGLLSTGDRTDLLLAALFGGLLSGIGVGVVMKGGANTGGTDIIAQVINHYSRLPLGTSLYLVDGFIVALAAWTFSIEEALFAVITLFAAGQFINMITSGANYAKMTYIISDKYELIRAELVAANFGGTVVDSFGMFSDDRRQMLMLVVRNRKLSQITSTVRRIDPDAFMIITNAHEVLGEGFIAIDPKKTGR